MPGLIRAIDVSSAQPEDLASIIATYKPVHVVVKLYLPWESVSPNHSRAQIESARVAGCTVGGYVWAYHDSDPVATVDAGLDLAVSCGLSLPALWLDCETYSLYDTGPDAAWLRAAFAECQRRGIQPGVYSGNWWLTAYLQDLTVLDGVWLWLAEYNGKADLESVELLPGMRQEQLVGHQYSATGLDMDMFDAKAS